MKEFVYAMHDGHEKSDGENGYKGELNPKIKKGCRTPYTKTEESQK